MKKYWSAVHVRYNNNSLYDDKNRKVTKRKMKLVYYDKSPDYCKKNKKLEIPGVEGRECEATNPTELQKCTELCQACGLKAKTFITTRKEKCNCKFVWCCLVKCQTCKRKVTTVKCVSR